MELEAEFVRDHMNQYEQVSCFYFLVGYFSSSEATIFQLIPK